MNKPEVYLKHIDIVEGDTKNILKKYFHLIRQSTNKSKAALDIGCGPGNVTQGVLFPFLEKDIDEVIGVDIDAKMIEYANKTYGNNQFKFRVADLGEIVPDDFVGRFDYIFSFWALQWIQDQSKLYSNIMKMLKPNGDMFVIYIARSKLYDIYQAVWNKPKYAQYIPNFNTAQSPFQKSKKPVEELLQILKKAGLQDLFCETVTVRLPYTRKGVESFLLSLSPHYDRIPKELQNDFLMDHVNLVDTTSEDSDYGYYIDYELFITHARKI